MSQSLSPKEYQEIVQRVGHLPTGIFAGGLRVQEISSYLAKNIPLDESLIDVIGVRYEGITSYFVLTQKRVICISSHKKFFEVPLKNIKKVVSGSNGFSLLSSVGEFKSYFVDLTTHLNFPKSLESASINVEKVDEIPNTKHEKQSTVQAFIGLAVVLLAFGSCTYNTIRETGQSPSSPTAAEIEECLRRYIRGETVSEEEIEAAYRNCR